MLSIFLLGLLQTQLLELQAEIPNMQASKMAQVEKINEIDIIPTLAQELATTSRIARKKAVEKRVSELSKEYNVSAREMMAVLECENNTFLPDKQSLHKDNKSPNGYEQSYGLAQWNVVHNDITIEQAKDPEWSLTEMAKMFSKGKKSMWSCWRIINSTKVE